MTFQELVEYALETGYVLSASGEGYTLTDRASKESLYFDTLLQAEAELDAINYAFEDEEFDGYEYEDDGQPDEYTEWQDVYGGDDWDHGQFDHYDEY